MNVLLYRPLVMMRSIGRKKEKLGTATKPGSLLKAYLEVIKRITLVDIHQGAVNYAGKGGGPAFIRERNYLCSILPDETFASTHKKRNILVRVVIFIKLLSRVTPLLSRLIRHVARLRKNKRLSKGDLENYVLFLADFLLYRYLIRVEHKYPKCVLTHSLLSPRGLSLITAAICENIPSIYIVHGACKPLYAGIGMPTFPISLHLLKNQASYDAINLNSKIANRVAFYGLFGKEAPLRPIPERFKTLGICLPYAVAKQELERMVDCVLKTFAPETVTVRFHPRDPLGKNYQRENIQISGKSETIQDFANRCDLVIAGNTSAILDILKIGCPVVYVSCLDNYGWDIYGFALNKLVPGFDAFDRISTEATRAVYASGEWKERIVYFDSGYGKNRIDIDEAIKKEILAVFAKGVV